MKINHTHISHFDVAINKNVVEHETLIQLTGTSAACKRFAAYLGLSRNQMRMSDWGREPIEDSWELVDLAGVVRGQLHILTSGVQLVLNRAWMDQEVVIS